MRGRPPKPTRIKILEGNPGKRAINRSEPQPVRGLSTPPEHIGSDPALLSLWEHALQEAPKGLLGSIDRELLAAWCQAVVIYRRAAQDLQGQPLTDGAYNGRSNPLCNLIQKQGALVARLGNELGFSPSARSRLSVPPEKTTTENPFAKLIAINSGKK